MSRKEPELVYQYLLYEPFKNMIKNKTIRLSDISNSNDDTELKIIYEGKIYEAFEELYSRNSEPKYMRENCSIEELKSYIKGNAEYLEKAEKALHTQFVSCFSSEGDLLSQWRGYAEKILEDGKRVSGVSVGFSVSKLKELTEKNENINFGKVKYSTREQMSLLKKTIEPMYKDIKEYVKENGTIKGLSPDFIQKKYNDMLIRDAAYLKNNFFHEEKEYRLSYSGEKIGKKKINLDYDIYLSNDEFYSNLKETEKCGFYYLYMNNKVNDFIKDVKIGPKCDVKKEEVQELLKSEKIICNVSESRGVGVYRDSQNHR